MKTPREILFDLFYLALLATLVFFLLLAFQNLLKGQEDIPREDRDFYVQDWGVMSIKQIEDSVNADMKEYEKDMDLKIIEETEQFGMVFSFRWLKGKCDGDDCYLQNRMWRAVYGVDLAGYIVNQGRYRDVLGCVGFCYEDYEDLVIVVVPFEFCREANQRALLCNTVKKNVEYMEWLYDQIGQFRTGEEQYLSDLGIAPKKGIIV